jgi:hypothetical protein
MTMPAAPDPYTLDEEGRRIYPWPKSFAEIVQTSCYATMNLLLQGETRVEVCFPPLPLADLDWNTCDVAETRIVDANIQHAIAFAKLIIKDDRSLPNLNAEDTAKKVQMGAPMQNADEVSEMLKKRFKKRSERMSAKTVRILFPNKPDMLRARDIHYDKWRKMERPELLRRGYYGEVNEDNWPGPFEDVYVYVVPQASGDLTQIRNFVEKADAVATRQGRVLRHVLFNLNLNKLRGDIEFAQVVVPLRPGLATPKVQYDFLSTFRNSFFIRFGKYTMTLLRKPFNINYTGACYHVHPGPWQYFMQDGDGTYRTVDVSDKRPTILALKRRMMRAFGLARDAGLPDDPVLDDVYKPRNQKAGTIDKTLGQVAGEGFGDFQWYEGYEAMDEEVSDKWRLA